MKLTLSKSDAMDDWYVIERAEHDGRSWLENKGDYASLMCSSRFSDADVEGTAYEMRKIAEAIRARRDESFKRVGVSFKPDGVHFCSPRNSQRDGVVSIEEADDLAGIIEMLCGVEPAATAASTEAT